MNVNNQIISPRENKPIITIVQDTLLGLYKLTQSEIIRFNPGSNKIITMNNSNSIYIIHLKHLKIINVLIGVYLNRNK